MSKHRKMRLAQLSVDWKDSFSGKEITKVIKDVGGKAEVYDYHQDVVDSKVMFITSEEVSPGDLADLWESLDWRPGLLGRGEHQGHHREG